MPSAPAAPARPVPARRHRRRPSAKLGFTAWAMVMYAFLYLPILVMVIFAFDKPSAVSLACEKAAAAAPSRSRRLMTRPPRCGSRRC